jgi:hypothetical protein
MSETPAGWYDDDDASTNVAPNNTTQWWEVKQSLGGDSIGEYRLVSYVYDHDGDDSNNENGQFAPDDDLENDTDFFDYNDTGGDAYNPRGILTVQGSSADGSEAQIQVEIPLRINDLEEFAPILWIGSGGAIATPGSLNITDSANNKIILTNPGSGCSKPADISSNDVISDARSIPSIQSVKDIVNDSSNDSKINTSYNNDNYFGKVDPGIKKYTTGVAGDECEAANDLCYVYKLGSLTITKDATVDGAANVTVYVDGDVTIGQITDTTNLTVGADNSSSSDYFELYVEDNKAITINTGSSNTVTFRGLIHAPSSTLTINGGGNVNIFGSVWVNKFVNNTSGTVKIEGDKSSTGVGASEPAYKVYTTSEFRTPRPITGNPTEWVREEVE